MHWCGRDYQTDGGPAQTWHELSAGAQYPIRSFGQYPPLAWSAQELFAPVFPQAQSGACAIAVYLRTGPNAYQSYVLLGGP